MAHEQEAFPEVHGAGAGLLTEQRALVLMVIYLGRNEATGYALIARTNLVVRAVVWAHALVLWSEPAAGFPESNSHLLGLSRRAGGTHHLSSAKPGRPAGAAGRFLV